jgi:hypothetical protein
MKATVPIILCIAFTVYADSTFYAGSKWITGLRFGSIHSGKAVIDKYVNTKMADYLEDKIKEKLGEEDFHYKKRIFGGDYSKGFLDMKLVKFFRLDII